MRKNFLILKGYGYVCASVCVVENKNNEGRCSKNTTQMVWTREKHKAILLQSV